MGLIFMFIKVAQHLV